MKHISKYIENHSLEEIILSMQYVDHIFFQSVSLFTYVKDLISLPIF